MRSRILAASAVAAALTLGACGTGTAPAVTVGDAEISHADLDAEIDAIVERPQFFANVFGFCPTLPNPESAAQGGGCPDLPQYQAGTTPQSIVTFALRQRIFFTQVDRELAARGLEPTAEDRSFVNDALSEVGPDGRAFIDLLRTVDTDGDEEFITGLLDDFAAQVALQNAFESEVEFNEFIAEANKTVTVSSRYGVWDPLFGSLESPSGSEVAPGGDAGFPS